MKLIFTYIIAILCAWTGVLAQPSNPPQAFSFQDSVRLVLENTKANEAMAVAVAFNTAWSSLGPDQQLAIRNQARMMKKKSYKVRPHLVNYYGAIAAAVTIENADPSRITSFLSVAGKVIEKENVTQVNYFLQQSRDFFEHHSLQFVPAFQLQVLDDSYQFDYLEPVIIPDTVQVSYEEQPVDTSMYNAPMWQQPIFQPELFGPVLKFDKATLHFKTPYDSVFLKNTKGTFSLRDKLFVGEGGRFDWSNTGLSADSVYYDFNKYNFKTTQPYIKAEQGKLRYIGKVSGLVPGIFEFRSINHKTPEAAIYPRFRSYETNINLLGLGDDRLKYTGGLGLQGRMLNSNSANGSQAMIEISGETDKRFKAIAESFGFKDSIIVSSRARISIYQQNDSIVHPAMEMRYDYRNQKMILNKEKSQLRKAPFSSSYFDIEFTADRIDWDLKSDSMKLSVHGSGKVSPMVIESNDFYDPEGYRELRGQGFNFHPLALMVNYANEIGSNDFYVFDLVVEGQRSLEQVRMAADFLSQKGMIDYDARSGRIHVKEKSLNFLEAAKGNSDYDNMKIHSLTDTIANAFVSFSEGRMNVYGVEEFNVSDSLNVVIKPDSSRITFLQNRDIKFNGTINAGNFEITGRDFTLKYDSFFINMNHIDSIRFYVTEKNGTRRRVNNAMVGADSTAQAAGGLQASAGKTSGTLFINRPDNKSGKIKYPNYPRLDATAGGVIYFDRSEVLNGAYDRSVFFVVPPFKLDSLNDADPGSINFDGTFVSSGMFPSFKEKLHTMPDKSLGFTHAVPTNGYSLYQGDGKLYGGMSLDNAGIRAVGRIDYLAATVESKDFVFYPDSVVGRGATGEINEKQFGAVYFPQVKLTDYQLNWLPKRDKMNIRNLKEPFSLYQTTATLDGKLIVSKTGVAGDGRLSTRGSEVRSKELNFSAKEFGARHARFEVKTGNPDKPALAGSDVKLNFNLDKNIATISPEVEGEAAIDFPYAQFKTSIPEARWDLNTQKIVMSKAPDDPLEDSYFYTTRKELDSLSFNAEKAEYDIKTQQLKVSGIPYIIVADAKITPENNEVLILENAKIGQLKNTTIVLDTLNGYHILTDGVVDIVSRKEFTGYATYQYINAVNDTFAIKMTDFHLEPITEETRNKRQRGTGPSLQTVGNGTVSDLANIRVAPRIFYKGDMTMYATKPALQLKGFVKMDLKKIKDYNTWLLYTQSGDEKEIYLDFTNAVTEEGRKPDAGLHFAEDNSLYITFVFDKKDPSDDDFFLPSGSLFYDETTKEFRIEDRAKSAGEKLSGKVFAYNEDKQEVRFEGPVSFFKGSKDFNLTASALGSGNLETDEIKMNSFVMADMNLPPTVFQLMATTILNVIQNEGVEEDGLGDPTDLLYKIADIVGERVVKDYEQRSLQSYVSLATVQGLQKPIVISNADLKWSQENKSFYSEGLLGISHIGRTDINGAFEGFMEIRKNEDGAPVFHLFIKASPEAWFYFGMEDNRLMVHSSIPAINDVVTKKTNASKAKLGELVFIPGTDDETLAWINRFRQIYYRLEAPYDLSSGNTETKKKEKKKEEDDGF
ncbi:MAG: hypothetical protein JNJ65_08615 [Cyclobacteriaceae bacterium]|nr:hypothetical protein [Cyclobacteriaceae bacterium]